MVFGQSGGDAKIATLMAMPAARGLCHSTATMSERQATASGPVNATGGYRHVSPAAHPQGNAIPPILGNTHVIDLVVIDRVAADRRADMGAAAEEFYCAPGRSGFPNPTHSLRMIHGG